MLIASPAGATAIGYSQEVSQTRGMEGDDANVEKGWQQEHQGTSQAADGEQRAQERLGRAGQDEGRPGYPSPAGDATSRANAGLARWLTVAPTAVPRDNVW